MRYIVIIAAGLLAGACSKAAVEDVPTAGPLSVHVEQAVVGAIRTSVAVTGTVTPAPGADWTISAPALGRIAELPKAEGDVVNAGDLLVRFDIPSLEADVLARAADVQQAAARRQAAATAVVRISGLVERGVAAQRELDDARREQQEADAAVRGAESAKAAADALAARVTVTARFAGVIARRWHNVGDQVDGSAGDPVLRVIDPARLEVIAAVPAAQLSVAAPGRSAEIHGPGDDAAIEGVVVARPPAVDGSAATGDVRIALRRTTAASLFAGTPVQVEIQGAARTNVLIVPTDAVQHDDEQTFVMVAGADGKAHKTSVKTGANNRESTEILSGLAAGDRVIVGGDAVPDGAPVAVVK